MSKSASETEADRVGALFHTCGAAHFSSRFSTLAVELAHLLETCKEFDDQLTRTYTQLKYNACNGETDSRMTLTIQHSSAGLAVVAPGGNNNHLDPMAHPNPCPNGLCGIKEITEDYGRTDRY